LTKAVVACKIIEQSGKSWLVKDVVSSIHKGVEAEFDNGG